MPEILLVAVIGPPACGKSTLCSRLASEMQSHANVMILCYDNLIPNRAFCLNELTETTQWRQWRQAIIHCVERVILQHRASPWNELPTLDEADEMWKKINPLHLHPDRDLVILLDDNFYYTSMRRPIFNLAKQYTCGFATIECHCPVDLCQKRNSSRLHPVPAETLVQMVDKFEYADPNANRWEQHTVQLNCSSSLTKAQVDSVIEKLLTALKQPFSCADEEAMREQQSRDRKINLENVLHAVDNAVRGHIRRVFESKDSSWRRQYSKLIGRLKAETLSEVRSSINSKHFSETLPASHYEDMAVNLFDKKLSILSSR